MTAPNDGASPRPSRRRALDPDAEPTPRVLVTMADRDPAVRVAGALEQQGIDAVLVPPVDDVRTAVRREQPDVVVFTGGVLDPIQLALVTQLQWDGVPAVALSDVDDPQTQARLRDAGYAALYPKPVLPEEVAAGVRRQLDRRRLAQITGLYGESEAVRQVLLQVEQMAPVSSTVLVEGESGTGKELVARGIHRLSPRRGRPFIAVNVGALPESLLESELFGYERGAFTGAAERRLGRFELADTGTLFLDEIGDIPPATQVKLLRVLEEREVTRLGGTSSIPVNVRVVAATNRPLRDHVAEGTFRADLYYRLNVLRIYLPPLRERREDIPLLVRRFVAEFAARHDRPFHGISGDAMRLLVDYAWPGNVRELRNLIESMVVLAPGRELRPEDLPQHLRERDGLFALAPGGGGVPNDARLRAFGSPSLGAPMLGGPMLGGPSLGVGASLAPSGEVGPVVPFGAGSEAIGGLAGTRDGRRYDGRELEAIARGLLDLRLQVEELRRGLDTERTARMELAARAPLDVEAQGRLAALAPPEPPPPNVVTVTPGMTMADVERAVIEAALRETNGNRRRAAELLDIGERTLYRKLNEYQGGEAE